MCHEDIRINILSKETTESEMKFYFNPALIQASSTYLWWSLIFIQYVAIIRISLLCLQGHRHFLLSPHVNLCQTPSKYEMFSSWIKFCIDNPTYDANIVPPCLRRESQKCSG